MGHMPELSQAAAIAGQDAEIDAAGSLCTVLGETAMTLDRHMRQIARYPELLGSLGVESIVAYGTLSLWPLLPRRFTVGDGTSVGVTGFRCQTSTEPLVDKTCLTFERCSRVGGTEVSPVLFDYRVVVLHPGGLMEEITVEGPRIESNRHVLAENHGPVGEASRQGGVDWTESRLGGWWSCPPIFQSTLGATRLMLRQLNSVPQQKVVE